VVFFEYVQILSPLLLFSLCFERSGENNSANMLIFILRLIDPSKWLLFNELDFLENVILGFSTAFIVSKFLLFGYVVYIAYHRAQGNQQLLQLWSYIFQLQGRIIYYIVSSFWVNAAVNQDYYTHTVTLKNPALTSVAATILFIEFFFVLALNIRFHYVLPNKNLTTAKDNVIETITIVQKLILQILTNILQADSFTRLWTFVSLNMVFDLARNGYFLKTLPYYRLKMLTYQGYILMAVSSLHVSVFIMAIVRTVNEESSSLVYLVILWAILSVLSGKIISNYLHKRFLSLLMNTFMKSPELLVHRILAIKELKKITRKHLKFNTNYQWTYLVNATINSHLLRVLRTDETVLGDIVADINNDKSADILFHNYLEKLLEEYPNNKFVKLFVAKFYIKTPKVYRDAARIVLSLKTDTYSQIGLTASMLLLEIQELIKNEYMSATSDKNKLNLWVFMNDKYMVAQLKEQMKTQAKLQIKICHEILKEEPNLAQIWDDSQHFMKTRKNVIRTSKRTLRSISEAYVEPLLLCSEYHLTLNHSLEDSLNYSKAHSLKLIKLQKGLNQDSLASENMYQDKTATFIMSGNRADIGKILSVSKSMETLFGGDARQYSGIHIASLTLPALQNAYLAFYKSVTYRTEQMFFGAVARSFCYRLEGGYMFEADFVINLYPVITQDFYLLGVVRPVLSNKDHIHILENGDIDCATKDAGEKLGLLHSKNSPQKALPNLSALSEELAMANRAFNMMAFPERYQNEEYEEQHFDSYTTTPRNSPRRKTTKFNLSPQAAQELYNTYTTTGKDVLLRPITAPDDEEPKLYSYNCKISTISPGGVPLRFIVLEENLRENKQRSDELENTAHFQTNYLTKAPQFEDVPEDGISESFESEHEKKDGWINFEAMTSQRTMLNTAGGTFSPRKLLLLKTDREPDSSTTRFPLISPAFSQTSRFNFEETTQNPAKNNQDTSALSPRLQVSSNEINHDKALNVKELFNPHGKISLNLNSQQQKVAKLYKKSLDTNYFPRFVRGLYCLFYFIFILLVGGQIALTINLGFNTTRLQVKKDILRIAQYRNYQMVSSESIIRLLRNVKTGALNTSALGPLYGVIALYPTIAKNNFVNIGKANQNLFANTSKLNENIANIIFDQDIKVYNTYFDAAEQSYESLNTFQAVDRLIETAFKVLNSLDDTSEEAVDLANFMFRNSLNDLVVKNEAISTALLSSLESQGTIIKGRITLYWVALILVYGGLMAIYGLIIYRQYNKESENLLAVCRINPTKLETTMLSFEGFKDLLESDDDFQSSLTKKRSMYHHLQKAQTKQIRSKNESHKRESSKNPVLTHLKRKYYLFGAKLAILAIGVILFIAINSVITWERVKTLQTRQSQIYFADRTQAQIVLAVVSQRELVATNNLGLVENQSPEEELQQQITRLGTIRKTAYNMMTTSVDKAQEAKIEDLLSGNGCQYIFEKMGFACNMLDAASKKSGLIYLLTYLEDYLTDQLQKYQVSDKSEASRKALMEYNFYMISLSYILGSNMSEELASTINENFEDLVDESDKARVWALVFAIFFVSIVCFMLWKLVLVKLKGGVNEFKNVLRVFPGNLILANFSLKTFLIMTSKGVLDSIRNDI